MALPRAHGLVAFLRALVGYEVVLELRTEAMVRGRLASVDRGLNCTLHASTGVASPPLLSGYALEAAWVAGRTIKYVHLPASLSPDDAWRAHEAALHKRSLRTRAPPRRTTQPEPEALARKRALRSATGPPLL